MLGCGKIEDVDLPPMFQAWWSGGRERRTGARVSFDDSGITQIALSFHTQFAWQQITAVYAYKRDCFGIDQIRIVLGNETLQNWIEITEDDEGYEGVIAALPHQLPGCLAVEEWWQCVAFPPFETQWTALYQRA